MLSTNHVAEGQKNLKKGLKAIKNQKFDRAIVHLFKAAVSFEQAQDFRQIPAIWEAIGFLSDPLFKKEKKDDYQLLLEYRTISWDKWNEQTDQFHQQAWAYQWAAEHRERAGDSITAYNLYLKAAERSEQAIHSTKYRNWPVKLYSRAILNYIRTYGTIDTKEMSEAIQNMDQQCDLMKNIDLKEAYRLSAISYRLFKTNLINAGNLVEAEQLKRKERSALMHYYYHNKKYFRALAEWLSGIGFIYFIVGWAITILFIFPFIYYQWDLIIKVDGDITYLDAIFYSIKSALNIGYREYHAIGLGNLIHILESALSWLGLGVFIWWITKQLE